MRQDALKHHGARYQRATALSELLLLMACSERKKKRIILYFTSMGNCPYMVCQFIQKTQLTTDYKFAV